MNDPGGQPTSQRDERTAPPPGAEALTPAPTPAAGHPTLPVEAIRASVRGRIGEVLAPLGFRAAQGAEDAWVRPCCEGILQVAQVTWVLQVSHLAPVATLGFGYHVVAAEALYATVLAPVAPRTRYCEASPTLHVRLDALLPRGARRDWMFSRTPVPGAPPPCEPGWATGTTEAELEELCEVADACARALLRLHRSGEDVLDELERQYAAARAPGFTMHLRFACREVALGRTAAAIARVERALAALDAADASGTADAHRRAGADALERFRRWAR